MTYVEGFLMPVPRENRDGFIDFSNMADELWTSHGAVRILECWPDDASPSGNDLFSAAAAGRDGEAIVFSWIEWKDKAARTENIPILEATMMTHPGFDPTQNPLPFDNDRVITGCFQTIVERGAPAPSAYVQGFVLPVREDRQAEYRRLVEEYWETVQAQGALRLVAAWEDEFPEGKQVQFFHVAKTRPDEKVVFAFIEWPSRELCEAAGQARTSSPPANEPPFDRARLVSGGFSPVVEVNH